MGSAQAECYMGTSNSGKQCAPNSYWIMQENGTEQPKVYRHTRTMLKIRSTPTEGKQTAQMEEWSKETRSIKSNIPAIPYGTRDCVTENSQRYASSNTAAATAQIRSSRS